MRRLFMVTACMSRILRRMDNSYSDSCGIGSTRRMYNPPPVEFIAWASQEAPRRKPFCCFQKEPVSSFLKILSVGEQRAGLLTEAHDACLAAVALDPQFAPALNGLGYLEGARGNIGRVSGERKSKIVWLEAHGGCLDEACILLYISCLSFCLYFSEESRKCTMHVVGRRTNNLRSWRSLSEG